MYIELSKENSFDSLILKMSLDKNTTELIGKATKEEIIKSLLDNMNNSNMATYRKLIAKAEEEIDEEEQAFQTQLGGKGSQRYGVGESKVEEDSLEEDDSKEVSSTKFEYNLFLKARKKYEILENSLSSLKDLSNQVQLEKNPELSSGYELFNTASYDNLVRKNRNKSDVILNAMSILERNNNALVESDRNITDGKLVAPTPPRRLDKETQEFVSRNKKKDIDVANIQKELLTLMEKSYPVEGEEDMSFADVYKNLHINQFDRTPRARRSPKKYLQAIEAAKKSLEDNRPKDFSSKIKKLGQLVQELKLLYELEIPLIDRIAKLESYQDEKNLEELITFAVGKLKESLKLTTNLQPTGESVSYGGRFSREADKLLLDRIKDIKGKKDLSVGEYSLDEGKVVIGKKTKAIEKLLSREITRAKEELSKLQKTIDSIQEFDEPIKEIVGLMSRVNRLDKKLFTTEKQELDELKNKFRILTEKYAESPSEGTGFANRVEFDERLNQLDEQIKEAEKDNALYFSVVSKLNESYNIIFDSKDEMERINQNLRKLKKSGELDAMKLTQDITLNILQGRDITNLRSQEYKSKLTSLTEEELEETLSNADKTIEILNKLDVNVASVKEILEQIRSRAI